MNLPIKPEEPHFEVPPTPPRRFKGPWKKLLGWFLILIGIVGLFLPFFPGGFVITAGIYLIENKWIIDKFKKIQRKFKNKTERFKKYDSEDE